MTSESLRMMKLPAIDVHGHIGVVSDPTPSDLGFFSVPVVEVVRRAAACDIEITCVSDAGAFSRRRARTDVLAANRRARKAAERHERLRFYAVLDPKQKECWKQVNELLQHPRCVGVKLHPRWSHWSLDRYGERIFAFLAERRAVAITHTGNPGDEPERFIPFADRFPEARLILAHLGHDEEGGAYDLQIKGVKKSRQGNVWTDTSSSRSITAKLIERAVQEIGADRLLFGTDTPLYFAAMQKARIAYADIPKRDKVKILRGNAQALLRL
ncbi:MAG: amidohydrolase family protein [Planctomycetota bacterium]